MSKTMVFLQEIKPFINKYQLKQNYSSKTQNQLHIMRSQTKLSYPQEKFNQGISTIRSRINVINSNNNGVGNSISNKTIRSVISSSNTGNRMNALIEQLQIISEAVRQSIFQAKGSQQNIKIIKDTAIIGLSKQQTEMTQEVNLLSRSINYHNAKNKQRLCEFARDNKFHETQATRFRRTNASFVELFGSLQNKLKPKRVTD